MKKLCLLFLLTFLIVGCDNVGNVEITESSEKSTEAEISVNYTEEEAREILWNILESRYNNSETPFHLDIEHGKIIDVDNYYFYHGYFIVDDHSATTGWYAVNIETGECFEINLVSNKLIPIKEETIYEKAYKNVLYDFLLDNYDEVKENSAFSLYDMDKNGIPELIISDNLSHVAGCHIYTFENGEAVYIGKYGAYGSIMYYDETGIIESYNISQGFEDEIFFRFENNEMVKITSFFNDLGTTSNDKATFKHDDDILTQDEYNAEIYKYKKYNYITLGRDYTFDEINSAFALTD